MKYWQVEGGTALERANEERRREQEPKENAGLRGPEPVGKTPSAETHQKVH